MFSLDDTESSHDPWCEPNGDVKGAEALWPAPSAPEEPPQWDGCNLVGHSGCCFEGSLSSGVASDAVCEGRSFEGCVEDEDMWCISRSGSGWKLGVF